MINKVILVGNVGQDPEVRYTGDANNGAKVATLRLATTERYRDRNGNLQEHTEWHSVVVCRKGLSLGISYPGPQALAAFPGKGGAGRGEPAHCEASVCGQRCPLPPLALPGSLSLL